MARARNIKPGFFRNADLAELPIEARLLFIGLWTLADRSGRLEDRPRQIKMEVFPADSVDVDACLDLLGATGMLTRYSFNGMRCIQITNFAKHQNPHRDEKPSTLPDMDGNLDEPQQKPEKHGASTVQAQCKDGAPTMPIGLNPESCSLNPESRILIPDSLIPRQNTKKEINKEKSAAPPFVLPDWVNLEHWETWNSCPKRKKASDAQKRMAVGKLSRWREEGQDFAGALENAAIAGNQGLFLPNKPFAVSSSAKGQPLSFAEQDRRAGIKRWEQMTNERHPDNPDYLDDGDSVLDVVDQALARLSA